MSVAGLCGVCERGEANYVCERCGTPVCEEHYDRQLSLCSKCATEVRAGRGDIPDGEDQQPDSPHGDGSWHR